MDAVCCKKCGNTELVETIQQSGPHYSRIDCPDCGFVKWGKKPRKENEMADTKITFEIGIPNTKIAEVGLGTYEREKLLQTYSNAHRELKQMIIWFYESNVSAEQKKEFMPTLREMLKTCVLILDLMERAGIPDEMIAEDLTLPFF